MYTQLGQWKNATIKLATVAKGGSVPTTMEKTLPLMWAVYTRQGYAAGIATVPELCLYTPHSKDIVGDFQREKAQEATAAASSLPWDRSPAIETLFFNLMSLKVGQIRI